MRNGLLASIPALLVSATLIAAQAPGHPGEFASEACALPAAGQPAALVPPAGPPAEATSVPIDDGGVPEAPGCASEPLAGAPGRFYARGEYLLWWTRGQQLPALVTIGSPDDVPPAAIGQPNTQVLFGNSEVDTHARSGGRLTVGYWLDADCTLGVEASGFYLSPHSTHYLASSDGSVLLAEPFFAEDAGAEAALVIAAPGVAAGGINVSTSTRFWGAQANGLLNVDGDHFYRLDLLAGFRYVQLKDGLTISATSDTIPPTGPTTVTDAFATRNTFYGGQLGAQLCFQRGPWSMDLRGTLAVGSMHRVVGIDGSTTFVTAGVPTVVPGGLFAQPTNIGFHSRYSCSAVPEILFDVSYQLTHSIRLFAGYSIILMTAARPGDQIDRSVNSTQVPALHLGPFVGDARPAFNLVNQDFWAQGISAGLELDF
jgi:hypothetical protein